MLYVVVQTMFEALHCWRGAAGPEAYLGNEHRHMFFVELKISVEHKDREIEIIACKRWLDRFLSTLGDADEIRNIGNMSCEAIGVAVVQAAQGEYGGNRSVSCRVLEDGLLGAEVCD